MREGSNVPDAVVSRLLPSVSDRRLGGKKKGVLACGLHVWLVAFGRCLALRRCLVHAALCLGVAPHVVWRRVVRVSLRLRRVLLDA